MSQVEIRRELPWALAKRPEYNGHRGDGCGLYFR